MRFFKKIKYSKIIKNFKKKFEDLDLENVDINQIYQIVLRKINF